MNRPDNIQSYEEINLKLGIKSSLPNIKSTLALAILFWESTNHPSELIYSQQDGECIVISKPICELLVNYLADICKEDHISPDILVNTFNKNQLFKSQLEALIVAFELVWKIAKINFADVTKPSSSERKGKIRFPKKITYSSNIDIIHCLISANKDAFLRVLLSWTNIEITVDHESENILINLLTALSEDAVFKLIDGTRGIIFNQNSLYLKLLSSSKPVDISGDGEAKGSLRILKSLLSEGMNSYLHYSNGSVTPDSKNQRNLEKYQVRVDTLLRLNAKKIIGLEDLAPKSEENTSNFLEENRLNCGTNILLYGVPGSGKSWTIEHDYCKAGCHVERIVFHPDFTYSDFVGQILPDVDASGLVTYKFVPGPFTNILRDAYINPTREYILIIEEINRGNTPAIFGDIFQLLDRMSESKIEHKVIYHAGTSEYGITNQQIAGVVYGDNEHKVRIPSNLSIIGTMNTSDQNVFTLDTAFQRRWNMRLIENTFENVRSSLANAIILDTNITWKRFCTAINNIILKNKANMVSSEDKRLGVYFVKESDLVIDTEMFFSEDNLLIEYNDLLKKESDENLTEDKKIRLYNIRQYLKKIRIFPEKVIKYLWDDAFRFNPDAIFDTDRMYSLEQVISTFIYSKGDDRFNIFKASVRDSLYDNSQAK